MVLRGERYLGRNKRLVVDAAALFFGAAIEPDGGFEHQKNVVAFFLNLADHLGDALGLGQRFVDRIAELLHQLLETLVHMGSDRYGSLGRTVRPEFPIWTSSSVMIHPKLEVVDGHGPDPLPSQVLAAFADSSKQSKNSRVVNSGDPFRAADRVSLDEKVDHHTGLLPRKVHAAQRRAVLREGLAAGRAAVPLSAVAVATVLAAVGRAVVTGREELAAWAKRFPDEFYEQMFRLRGWEWKGMKVNKPQVVGHYTRDLVYERLAPGILQELEERTPKNSRGQRKARFHQWLTADIGHPALAQHLYALIGFMRVADSWKEFYKMVERAYPKKGHTLFLPLAEGKG